MPISAPRSALATASTEEMTPIWRFVGIMVLTLRGSQVSALTRFGDVGLLARFGLPRTMPRE